MQKKLNSERHENLSSINQSIALHTTEIDGQYSQFRNGK